MPKIPQCYRRADLAAMNEIISLAYKAAGLTHDHFPKCSGMVALSRLMSHMVALDAIGRWPRLIPS